MGFRRRKGLSEGFRDVRCVRKFVGRRDGLGFAVGVFDGLGDGLTVLITDGLDAGLRDGVCDGFKVLITEGVDDGELDDAFDDLGDGCTVLISEGLGNG